MRVPQEDAERQGVEAAGAPGARRELEDEAPRVTVRPEAPQLAETQRRVQLAVRLVAPAQAFHYDGARQLADVRGRSAFFGGCTALGGSTLAEGGFCLGCPGCPDNRGRPSQTTQSNKGKSKPQQQPGQPLVIAALHCTAHCLVCVCGSAAGWVVGSLPPLCTLRYTLLYSSLLKLLK